MKNKNIILIILFAIWVIVAFCVGINHENWADEAQAWLIARDNSVLELITKAVRYEGAPILWYLILKFLQLFKYPYQFLFLISLLFTGIGVFLLMFKSKLPYYIKCTFPFTFFIMYQYAVIARNYTLTFPILAIIALIYSKRLEKIYFYSFLLILLVSTNAYSYTIAFVLLMFLIYDIIRNKQISKKVIIPVMLVSIIVGLTPLYTYKPVDCTFGGALRVPILEEVLCTLASGYFNLSEERIVNIFLSLITIIFYIFAFSLYCKSKYYWILSLCLNLGVLSMMTFLYANEWHMGYLILTLIFNIWILCEDGSDKINQKILQTAFIISYSIIAIVQIYWTVKNCLYDIKNIYSGSYEAAMFIKKNNLDRYNINGLGFRTIALQPYFNKKNIYKNFDKSYWFWQTEAEEQMQEKGKILTDVFVIDLYEVDNCAKYIDTINSIDESNQYNSYTFDGNLWVKGRSLETTSIKVYIKKNIEI